MQIEWKPLKKLTALLILFSFMAAVFIYVPIYFTSQLWWIIVIAAMGFFAAEMWENRNEEKGRLRKAFLIGIFLWIFDFAFQNLGGILGLWKTTNSVLAVGVVPIEVMLVAVFGGTAWALYLPKKFNALHSALDITIFAFFGTLGEFLLIQRGYFAYFQWWNSFFAFISYAGAWLILHFLRYRVVAD